MPKIRFPPRKQKKKGHLTHQLKQAPGGRVSPPGASHQTMGKSSRYRPAVTNSSACLALSWRVAGGLFRLARGWRSVPPGAGFTSPGASCRHFSSLFAIPGHSLVWIFGTKLPIYKKDTKMGISGIFRSM